MLKLDFICIDSSQKMIPKIKHCRIYNLHFCLKKVYNKIQSPQHLQKAKNQTTTSPRQKQKKVKHLYNCNQIRLQIINLYLSQARSMSELSKFINLVIEYGQKVESTLNKKYKPFIRSICNLQQLAKNVDPQNIFLTREMIIFKLGLQAKSTKSIQVSLFYLQKFFLNKFVDLNVPNYCEEFQIQQTTVRRKQNIIPKSEFRSQIVRMLQPLIHFKSSQINLLLLRVYQFLITQPIAPILIQLNSATPNTQIGQKILFNYYSYRFYIFEEIYTFTEAQFRSINALSIRNERINKQIQAAFVNHQNLLDLVHKYVGEMVAVVAGIGGKYGLCVICREPADYFCKITRASLCGADCKKRHLELAEKQYRGYYQAVNLWKQIQPNFQLLLEFLTKKQARGVLSVLVGLLEKAHLFMIVRRQFRGMIGRHVASIINMALNYKDQQSFQVIYSLISVICRYWMVQSMSSIQYFFKESVLRILQDKKPNFKLLIIVFKSLAKIFQYGKTTIQLYINFDCQYNKTNIIQRILFQLSKISQDKFSSSIYYNKNQKTAIKNGAVTLMSIMVKGLNDYRAMYPEKIVIEQEVLQIKQRKVNLEKFIYKFNEHWSEGLKMLFNLNMVGLQSQQEIVEILLTIKGLKKEKIQEMLISQNGREYIEVLFEKIFKSGPFMGLVELFRVVPLKKSSVLLKHYSDFVLTKMIKAKQDENDQRQEYSVTKWVGFLTTNYNLKQLQKWLYMQNIKIDGQIDHVYMKCLQTKNEMTLGSHKTYFRHCISQSYLQVFGSQLSLLQIPILCLLETQYPIDKVFELISDLIQICPHANWITLCLKNVDTQKIRSGKYSSQDHGLIIGCLKLCKHHAQFIQDWPSILQFICKLYKIISSLEQNNKKLSVSHLTTSVILQENIKVKEELGILELEEYLLMIGENTTKKNFTSYVRAMICLAQEELQKQSVFFLQKTFQIIQHNLVKFIADFSGVYQELEGLLTKIMNSGSSNMKSSSSIKSSSNVKGLKENQLYPIQPAQAVPSQTLIYISDMLKQLFVKILKQLQIYSKQDQKQSQQKLSSPMRHSYKSPSPYYLLIQTSFFRLFQQILLFQNRQASDFVMNSISMIIMVHYKLLPETWSFIVVNILKENCKTYRQQVLTILQKIIKQKLHNVEHLEFEIMNLMLDLVDQEQVKLSIESVHMLKDFIEILVEQTRNSDSFGRERQEKNQENQKRKFQKGAVNQTFSKDKSDLKYSDKLVSQRPQTPCIQAQVIQSSTQQQSCSKQEGQSLSDSSQYSSSSQLLPNSPKKIKQYLLFILENLIEFISYECHEGAIQILFILLKTRSPFQKQQTNSIQDSAIKQSQQNTISKMNGQSSYHDVSLLFQSEQIDTIINKIFKKLQSLPKQLLARGQKIMNESLFWSVRNKSFGIVKNLQQCIIDKYSSMSYTAMKCIKTFISMTNPKKPQDWNPIEETLVKILKNTHLKDVLQQHKQSTTDLFNIQQLVSSGKQIPADILTNIPLSELSNKLIIQRMTVEVLPNDVTIIQELLKIYQQTLQFNDNLFLRCILWREGLGASNKQSPPDVLSLQELISYRIISTYYWSKEYQKIADFILAIIERYCQASQKWQQLQSRYEQIQNTTNNKAFQLYMLSHQYWNKRRQPLKVIINYMLPKLPNICKSYNGKQKLIEGIIQGMKYSEERTAYVETIRQMTLVR